MADMMPPPYPEPSTDRANATPVEIVQARERAEVARRNAMLAGVGMAAALGGGLPMFGLGHKPQPAASLTDRIRRAATAAEVDALLAEGSRYTRADAKTRAAWEKIADVRRAVLATVGVGGV